jgi:hypothetical protein
VGVPPPILRACSTNASTGSTSRWKARSTFVSISRMPSCSPWRTLSPPVIDERFRGLSLDGDAVLELRELLALHDRALERAGGRPSRGWEPPKRFGFIFGY